MLHEGASENYMVDLLRSVEVETKCWLLRVPSQSNIADKPSRGLIQELLDARYGNHSLQTCAAVKQLFAFMEKKMGQRGECSVVSSRFMFSKRVCS